MSETVAVAGAGLMGSQIGCEYALAGHDVVWLVREPRAAQQRVEQALAAAVERGLTDEAGGRAARGRMRFAADGLAAGEPLALIVESLPEQLELKAAVMGALASEHPGALLATNTSSISISALAQACGAPARMVGTHYWNPPLLMPLVEVVAARETPVSVRDHVAELLRGIGKRPVILEHEVPGLLWNRLQLAVLRECLWLVEEGVASPETIDEVMRDGLARRWRLTGPFQTVGLGGAGTFDAIAENLFPVLSNAAAAGSGFAPHVPRGEQRLAGLRERRDLELARELERERASSE